MRYIDLSSFKFVTDTNEFKVGQKNLLPIQSNCTLSRKTINKKLSLNGTLLLNVFNVNFLYGRFNPPQLVDLVLLDVFLL